MQFKNPLILTLSPSDGEREQQTSSYESSNEVWLLDRLIAILPLRFGRGEGRGEGCFVVATQ